MTYPVIVTTGAGSAALSFPKVDNAAVLDQPLPARTPTNAAPRKGYSVEVGLTQSEHSLSRPFVLAGKGNVGGANPQQNFGSLSVPEVSIKLVFDEGDYHSVSGMTQSPVWAGGDVTQMQQQLQGLQDFTQQAIPPLLDKHMRDRVSPLVIVRQFVVAALNHVKERAPALPELAALNIITPYADAFLKLFADIYGKPNWVDLVDHFSKSCQIAESAVGRTSLPEVPAALTIGLTDPLTSSDPLCYNTIDPSKPFQSLEQELKAYFGTENDALRQETRKVDPYLKIKVGLGNPSDEADKRVDIAVNRIREICKVLDRYLVDVGVEAGTRGKLWLDLNEVCTSQQDVDLLKRVFSTLEAVDPSAWNRIFLVEQPVSRAATTGDKAISVAELSEKLPAGAGIAIDEALINELSVEEADAKGYQGPIILKSMRGIAEVLAVAAKFPQREIVIADLTLSGALTDSVLLAQLLGARVIETNGHKYLNPEHMLKQPVVTDGFITVSAS